MITWYVWVDSGMRATSLLVLRLHARFNDDFMVQDMVPGETEGSRFMLRLNPLSSATLATSAPGLSLRSLLLQEAAGTDGGFFAEDTVFGKIFR